MNQTRAFLIFAWLMVATLLWMEWGKERAAPAVMPAPDTSSVAHSTVPDARPAPAAATIPVAPSTPLPAISGNPSAAISTDVVTISTDVLRLRLTGGEIHQAELLRYPQTTRPGSAPARLFDTDPAHYYVAQSGWVSRTGAAPSHERGFVPVNGVRSIALAPGQDTVEAPFVWTGPDGVSIHRTYILRRGDYTVQVRDEIRNAGQAPWQGHVYRQLVRNPPAAKSGMTNPEAYSFTGAAWYSPADKYEKRQYDDFSDDGPLDKPVTGGWIGLLQHYFFAAWIPDARDAATLSLATPSAGQTPHFLARAFGPAVAVAPGQRTQTQARLWVGPKLQDRLETVAPGLALTLDYGVFTFLAQPLHWLLDRLHSFTGNWGWAIVLLVLLIKLALFPLSAAQYKSMAKMRRFQPRIEQLKERYGDDKQKMQMAMLELYKKEKINPVGGCLPVLLQIPVFLALYWVLLESVELRQAPWVGWITDLTARDPYFILPALNMAVMWATQKLSPMPGVDPMQKKMMQMMPLVFGVMFAFFPAGLVLYWVTNGALSLAQQWWMTRRYAEVPARA